MTLPERARKLFERYAQEELHQYETFKLYELSSHVDWKRLGWLISTIEYYRVQDEMRQSLVSPQPMRQPLQPQAHPANVTELIQRFEEAVEETALKGGPDSWEGSDIEKEYHDAKQALLSWCAERIAKKREVKDET